MIAFYLLALMSLSPFVLAERVGKERAKLTTFRFTGDVFSDAVIAPASERDRLVLDGAGVWRSTSATVQLRIGDLK